MFLGNFTGAFLSLSAALLLVVSPASGQTLKGTILGNVTDASHAVMPTVAVNLREVNTNFHRAEVTNESGFFAFANLDPGTYQLEITHPGFATRCAPGLSSMPTLRFAPIWNWRPEI
jgi:hypothetical protein